MSESGTPTGGSAAMLSPPLGVTRPRPTAGVSVFRGEARRKVEMRIKTVGLIEADVSSGPLTVGGSFLPTANCHLRSDLWYIVAPEEREPCEVVAAYVGVHDEPPTRQLTGRSRARRRASGGGASLGQHSRCGRSSQCGFEPV